MWLIDQLYLKLGFYPVRIRNILRENRVVAVFKSDELLNDSFYGAPFVITWYHHDNDFAAKPKAK